MEPEKPQENPGLKAYQGLFAKQSLQVWADDRDTDVVVPPRD